MDSRRRRLFFLAKGVGINFAKNIHILQPLGIADVPRTGRDLTLEEMHTVSQLAVPESAWFMFILNLDCVHPSPHVDGANLYEWTTTYKNN